MTSIRNKTFVQQVMIRDLGICRCCGLDACEVHHIIPLIYGGLDHPSNMVALCHECHRKALNNKVEFLEYMNMGGSSLRYIYGTIILIAEKNHLPIYKLIYQGKQIIKLLQDSCMIWALEKYNLKESMQIEDLEGQIGELHNNGTK